MSKSKKVPRPVREEKEVIDMKKINIDPKLMFDYSRQRNGVFVHSFICNDCGLHFNVFSWMENRHTARSVYCPECGVKGNFRHWKLVLSESPQFTDSQQEIFNYVPFHGSQFMDDSKEG